MANSCPTRSGSRRAEQERRDAMQAQAGNTKRIAFLFDLDGTLVDSVYQHALAWREALEQAGIELSVWRIHRRVGMSGGLFANALFPDTPHHVTPKEPTPL